MATLTYAGIGARATPAGVLADMTVMAGWLARTAIILGETCDRPVSAAPTHSQLTSLVGSPIRQDLDILGADTFAPCRIARNWECSVRLRTTHDLSSIS